MLANEGGDESPPPPPPACVLGTHVAVAVWGGGGFASKSTAPRRVQKGVTFLDDIVLLEKVRKHWEATLACVINVMRLQHINTAARRDLR